MNINFKIAIFLAVTFFTLGFLTNSYYGMSWDEPEHFMRGQAYLRLFLTGKDTYADLPKYELNRARVDVSYHQRSYYQNDAFNSQVWIVSDKGHPPLNDILAALFNNIFFQKLGLVKDVESYHLFNIFMGSVLVGIVFYSAAEVFGIWAGLFSGIFLTTYPLFWAESHFNIKDPAQTTFYILSLYFFWKGISLKRLKLILLSAFFAGLALSVKFNIFFIPFILGPWLLTVIILEEKKIKDFIFSKKTILTFLIFPLIMLSILIMIWPFLWQDIIGNTYTVFTYYKELGTEENFGINPLQKWNLYPTKWILYTTPPLTIISFLFGLMLSKNYWRKENYLFLLWSLLFFITVFRVSFPNTSIYGGVRQIMEYIPAMALIAGIGIDHIRKHFLKILKISDRRTIRKINISMIILILLISIYPIYKYFPNENVYFNFLIGGLSGAINNKIPSAGNSYGNAYHQVATWLNKNAQSSSRLALVQGTTLNLATIQLRSDIDFSNSYWSGINRDGEYLTELNFQGNLKLYPYAWDYINKFLEPVYEVKVDDVAIAKVWENDIEHTKKEYQKDEIKYPGKIEVRKEDKSLLFKLENEVILTRMVLSYTADNCNLYTGAILTSKDGFYFNKEQDRFPTEQVTERKKNADTIYFYFAGIEAKFIKIVLDNNSCVFNDPKLELSILNV